MEDDKLIQPKKILTIGRFKIDYTRISVERTLRAADEWDEVQKKDYSSSLAKVKALIGPVLTLINIDFRLSRLVDYLKRRLITTRYVLRHLDYTELSDFLEDALEPILGSKKKEEETVKKLTEAGLQLIEALGPERAAQLVEEFMDGTVEKRLRQSSPSASSSTAGPESTGLKS